MAFSAVTYMQHHVHPELMMNAAAWECLIQEEEEEQEEEDEEEDEVYRTMLKRKSQL